MDFFFGRENEGSTRFIQPGMLIGLSPRASLGRMIGNVVPLDKRFAFDSGNGKRSFLIHLAVENGGREADTIQVGWDGLRNRSKSWQSWVFRASGGIQDISARFKREEIRLRRESGQQADFKLVVVRRRSGRASSHNHGFGIKATGGNGVASDKVRFQVSLPKGRTSGTSGNGKANRLVGRRRGFKVRRLFSLGCFVRS